MRRFRKHVAMIPLLLTVFLFSLFYPTVTFAQESANVSTVSKINEQGVRGVMNEQTPPDASGSKGEVTMSDIDGSSYIPDTDIADANRWVSKKGEDLIGLAATIAEPVSILAFILGLAISLVGAITKSKHVVKGLLVMGISIIAYVGAVFAPELVHYFSTWLAS